MPGDTPRTDGAQQRAVYNGYSKLMQSQCAGHALFEPTKEGALGDGGYLDCGKFVKEFNIYEQSTMVPTPAPEQNKARITDAAYPYAMPLVSSHHTEVTGELCVESGETIVAPIKVKPTVKLKDEEYARLHAYAPKRQDYMKRGEVLFVRDWLLDNQRLLRSKTIVLTRVVRASGWVALYSSVRQQSASLLLGVGSQLLGILGKGSYEHADAKKIVTQGPEDWEPGEAANADHTVIVNYVRVLSRLEYLLHTGSILVSNYSHGSVSNRLNMTNATAGQTGANTPATSSSSTPPSTTMTSRSITGGGETDMDLLYPFLAAALDKQQDYLDVVAADTSILVDFMQRHDRLPDPIHDSIVIDVMERGGPTGERVGWISEIDAVNDGDHTAVSSSENSITDSQPALISAIVPIQPPVPSTTVSQPPQGSSGYVQRLFNHYKSLRLPPSTNITYTVQRGQGDSYIATVSLMNYSPPAYYVGTGIGQMGAKEAAAYNAGRALGLW